MASSSSTTPSSSSSLASSEGSSSNSTSDSSKSSSVSSSSLVSSSESFSMTKSQGSTSGTVDSPTSGNDRPNIWIRFTSSVDATMSTYFYHHGAFIARHPGVSIILCLIITGVCVAGFSQFSSETRPNRLFAPQNTRAFRDQAVYRRYFDESVTAGGVVIVTAADKGNLLTAERLRHIQDFHQEMISWTHTTTNSNGNPVTVSYNDLCKRVNGFCDTSSVLDYFNYSKSNIISDTQVRTVVSQPRAVAPTTGSVLIYSTLAGGVPQSELDSGTYTYSEAYIFSYQTVTTSEAYSWEDAWPQALPQIAKKLSDAGSPIRFTYLMTSTLEDELNRSTSGDLVLFSVTFTLMITFAILVMGSPFSTDIISNQSLLACMGVFSVFLAIGAALGLGMYFGIKFVSTVGVLPFLILGIGVDDMFIITAAYVRSAETRPDGHLREVEPRIAEALAEAGVSITMTSITDALAFAIGASSAFPAIRNFALFAMLAVIFDFIFQITFFVAFLTYDGRRMRAHRAAFPPFWKVARDSTACCHKPHLRESEDHALATLVKDKIGPMLMGFKTRIAIIIAFVILLGVSIWGVTKLEEGLDLRDLTPNDSYARPFFDDNEKYFSRGPVASIVVPGNIDWSQKSNRDLLLQLQTEMANSPSANGLLIRSWPAAFTQWALSVKGTADPPSAQFSTDLQEFLQHPLFQSFQQDFAFQPRTSPPVILATRVLIQHAKERIGSVAQGMQMVRLREILDKSDYNAFPERILYRDDEYIFFEQFLIIREQLILNLGLALVGVAVVTFVLLVHPGMALLTIVVVVIIDIDVLGLMHFWGVRIDSISLINLVLSIGFSVDFCAHIAHAFIVMPGSKPERAINALAEMGSSVLAGGTSTFVGVLVLAFAISAIFRIFFKMFFLILLLGMLHGLILVPVLLSFIGPKPGRAHGHVEELIEQHELGAKVHPVYPSTDEGVSTEVVEVGDAFSSTGSSSSSS